jgi:succinate dehydrogenase/fumarate reductase cytochrome b subunit
MTFIRFFHRLSGLFLFVFVGIKLISGYSITGHMTLINQTFGYRIHYASWIDIPLVCLFIFHTAYGFLKIGMPKRNEWKEMAFILTNCAAIVVCVLFIVFVYLL